MKFEFQETEYMTNIELIPETPADFAALARMTNNSRAEKPSIYLNFSKGSGPYCNIHIKKIKEAKQVNSLSSDRPTRR